MRRLLFSTVSLLALTVGALADDKIETIVVTATRTPQPALTTGESIDVITAQDLETQQIKVTSDALAETPGVSIFRNGAIGQPTSISIRGARDGQTVLLVDGIRFNDPSAPDDAAVVLQDLLANNIDRIEVLRGPQSTLYGSDAIGGVVSIFTKRGGADPIDVLATAEGGALDTVHLNLAANGTEGPLEYGSAVNFYDTRSVSAADSRNHNPEPDPYQHVSATSNLHYHVDDQLSVDLRGYFINGHASFDDGFMPLLTPPFGEVADSKAYSNNQFFAGYAGINYDLVGGMFRNRLAIMATASRREFFDSSFDICGACLNFADYGDTLRLEYQGIVDPTDVDEITFGAEAQWSGFRSNDYFDRFLFESDAGRSRIDGYYLQAQHRFFDQLTVTGGVRLDDDSEFGTHTSLKIAGAWQIPNWNTTLHANYGDGFRAPTLFEDFSVFSPPVPEVAPLKPESAKGWEVGISQPLFDSHVIASLTYYERNTSNLIDFFTCFTSTTGPGCDERFLVGGYYFNAGRTRSTGLEAELTAHLTNTLKLDANYTSVTAFDRDTGKPLQRQPHVEANAILTWAEPDWSVGGSMTYVGPRFDDAAATVPLHPVALFNIFGSYALTEHEELFARIENIANTHYEPLFGYGAPARAAFGGIRVRL